MEIKRGLVITVEQLCIRAVSVCIPSALTDFMAASKRFLEGHLHREDNGLT